MAWLKVIGVYALLNIGGGIEGYVTKHSIPSVMSGVTGGVLLIIGLVVAGSRPTVGYALCALIALGDLGFFTKNLVTKPFALWPAGIMAAASVAVLVCLAVAHFSSKGS